MKNPYKVGDKFQAVYSSPPVPPERQYSIGQSVDIMIDGKLAAYYRVEQTDDINISGTIIEVFDPMIHINNDRFPPTDPRQVKPL